MKTKISIIMLIFTLCFSLFSFLGCDTDKATGLSKDEWDAMLDKSNFENYTLTMNSHCVTNPLSEDSQAMASEETSRIIMKVTENKVHNSLNNIYNETSFSNEETLEGEAAESTKAIYLGMIEAFKYEYFDYDPETNVYEAKQAIEMPQKDIYIEIVDGEEIQTEKTVTVLWENVVIEISNGRIYKISYNSTNVNEEWQTSMEIETVLVFSDYGTTK